MAVKTEVRSIQPMQYEFEAKVMGSHGGKHYEAMLELKTNLSSLHAVCQTCGKSTKQHLAALGIEVASDCEAAITEALMRVGTDDSILEPTSVHRITGFAIMEIVNAAGLEIHENTDIYAKMKSRIFDFIQGKELSDNCLLRINLGAF